MTEEFFRITGPRHSRVRIRRLRRPDGSFASEPEDIRELASSFYRELLSAEAPSENQLACRPEVWGHVRRVVTSEMQDALLSPLTCEELAKALHALLRDSCPGEDGLGLRFFLQYWELVSPGLRALFQRVLDTGCTPESLTEGLIYLIPKEGGDLEEIC